MSPAPRWTGTTELVIQRCVEHIKAAIAAEADYARRCDLQDSFEVGDWHVQHTRPGFVLICVGADDVGEVSTVSLRRPDEPERN